MIDIHCHILPGVDDGSKDMKMTKELVKLAKKNGITDFIFTPHMEGGLEAEHRERVLAAFEETKKAVKKILPEAKPCLGCEIMYSESIVDELSAGKLFTMNNTDYVLVEFPTYTEFKALKSAVKKIKYAGYTPILAHIERYIGTSKVKYVEELSERGALMQVNCSTVAGEAGLKAKWYVLKLMKLGLVDFVATDAHRPEWRKPETAKAFKVIDKKFGREYRDTITVENQMKVMEGLGLE